MSNQVNFSIKSEQIKAILNLHEKYFFWLNAILNTKAELFNSSDIDSSLKAHDDKIISAKLDYETASAKAELLLKAKSSKYIIKSYDRDLKTIDFQYSVNVLFREFKIEFFKSTPENKSNVISHYMSIFYKKIEDDYGKILPIVNEFSEDSYDILASLMA